jgi:preprotein translocase subunit SecE
LKCRRLAVGWRYFTRTSDHRETLDVAKTKSTKKSKGENAVIRYLRDTRAELRKVRWPTRQEAWSLTKIVLAVTISMALFMGLMDTVFSWWLGGLVGGSVIAIIFAIVAVVGGIAALVVASMRGAQ